MYTYEQTKNMKNITNNFKTIKYDLLTGSETLLIVLYLKPIQHIIILQIYSKNTIKQTSF